VRKWIRGVDTARFAPTKRDAAWRLRVAPNGERIIGYVGRLAAEKQVEDLRVIATLPGVRLVIVGDGPLRGRLEQSLPTAHFAGFLGGDDLARALASFDVFVHPGELETFCQTIQEAMASGVPVVATGRGGPVDLVDSSRTGWLYEPGNLYELRDRVADLAGDPAKRDAFARAAHDTVRDRSWTAVCDALVEHYREAIALHASRPLTGWAPRAQLTHN
jgi:phosphatidylinositol alpha 1,6-mannosyltransferase